MDIPFIVGTTLFDLPLIAVIALLLAFLLPEVCPRKKKNRR